MTSPPYFAFPAGFRRAAAFLAAALLFLLPAALASPEKHARKVVRIPCLELNRVMTVDKKGRPVSGYAHDYIQTIATFAGWDVQYIPASSFSDAMNKLVSGEGDLFYEVSHTEERDQVMLFPDEPMGFEYYYLYVTDQNTDIAPDDYTSLEGKRVGVTIGTMQIELLKQWCEKKDVHLEFVEYTDLPVKEADLEAGRIDLDYEVSMMAPRHFSAVEKVGSSAYYLAVNKNRPDLVEDIDSAMDKVLYNDMYFFSRLQERYFADAVKSRNLTTPEREWVESHDTLRIGYFDHYLPFSTRDKNGNPMGSVIDAVPELLKLLELDDRMQVEFVCYDDQAAGYRAVESGEIDMMFPAYISGSVRQDFRIIGGKGVATLASDLAFLEEFGDGKNKRIGVNRGNLMQYYYSKDSYPDSEIVFYDGIRGCLDGLLEGTSDGTFLNGARTAGLLRPGKYHDLQAVRAKDQFQLCMAFAEENVGLMLLMNRGLTMLDPDFISKASYSYAGRIATLTLLDFFLDHILAAVALAAVLAALATAAVAFRIRNRQLKKTNLHLKANYETIERQRRELETKQSELENALRMAQSANRAKTTFLSNMSHDIRTPMNAIIGFAGLAASHLDEKEHVREYLTTIGQSSEHLLSLINDILDMSRIESGKINLREKAESLADILETLGHIVQADVQAKGHRFDTDLSEVRNDAVWCDKIRLNQVLLNLVSNAIKYTPPGGKISLRVIQKPAAAEGRALFEFHCRDNGIGMSEEFAPTIFDPFTREETSTISGIQGTGLGMSITKHLVDIMGGAISVATKKGKGSEFTVSLEFRLADRPPAAAGTTPEAPRAPGRADADSLLKGKRILMVDDSKLNLKIGFLLLTEQGMRVDTASDGQMAVDILREKGVAAYDFVLMDVQMPVMDGYAATALIRQLPDGDKLKILAFSANAFEEDKEKSLRAGMDGHISKPLTITEFLDAINRFC